MMSALRVPLVLATLAFALPQAAAAADFFPDDNLEAVIRDIVRKKSDKEELTEDDLKNVYILHAQGKGIKDLTGVEKCPNLAEVRLSKNEIEHVQPLSGALNCQSLDLEGNNIRDISPLAKLEKLQYLQLEDNEIEDFSPLKDLKKLSALYLSKNKIKSVEPLAGLERLVSLYLAENEITDISPLARLKWLSSLDLQGNKIADLKPLAGMTELRYTMLQKNEIEDLAPLVEMAKKDAEGDKRFAPYWNLYLGGNPLSDDAKEKQIPELKKYGVRVHP
jgi:Leucine-rich repeat (LRR) protein